MGLPGHRQRAVRLPRGRGTDSGAGGSWNDPANWSATPGGPGGAGVPANEDNADLTRTANTSVTFDGAYSSPGINALYLYSSSGATITLNQSANDMFAKVESIGIEGYGVYHRTGGSNTTTGDFHLGQDGPGTGSYVLDGGALHVGNVEDINRGSFTQNGGTHSALDIWIAFSPGSTGQFGLNNGPVSIDDYLSIGCRGNGTFTQTGGSVTAAHMQITEGLTGNATFNLQSGTLTVNGSEDIGTGGIGVFNQTGGTHTMTGNMFLTGTLNPGSSGTYNLNAGTLNV